MKNSNFSQTKIKQKTFFYFNFLFNYSRGFLILFLCLWIGNLASKHLLPTIPGSILGLIFLFILLTFKIIKTTYIKDICHFFMKYMAILFIPAALGIMDKYTILLDNFIPIVISCIGSTFIVLLLVGWLTSVIQKDNQIKINHTKKEEL